MSTGEHGAHHGPGINTYYFIFGSLAVLTVLTVGVSRMNFSPAMAVIVAILIAMWKASLVMAFFMHLKYDPKVIHLICVVPIILTVGLLLALLPDVGMVKPGVAGDPALAAQLSAQPADGNGHSEAGHH